jgi:hypothetical protein
MYVLANDVPYGLNMEINVKSIFKNFWILIIDQVIVYGIYKYLRKISVAFLSSSERILV